MAEKEISSFTPYAGRTPQDLPRPEISWRLVDVTFDTRRAFRTHKSVRPYYIIQQNSPQTVFIL